MPPVNPMMAALEQSRASNPAPSGAPAPGGMPPAQDPAQGQMAKLCSDVQDLGAKLDKILQALSGQHRGTAEGSEEVEPEEGKESGEAKTFK